MERSFKAEVARLRLGAGQTFTGEGILAVTKALLQSGVSYVGGYQGAPVSHLMDVLADARELLDELGVHFESCANEAGACAMLGASINYPLRGAATWKSVVGTNVASDALSNLSSAGVVGGTLIVIGEDYGEGASIIQERSHAFAQKSQVWLLDPRPNLPSIVRMVEKGFELSEASNTPVMLELRIRACHVTGSFETKDNIVPKFSRRNPITKPVFNLERIPLPPHNYTQEKLKIEVRLPEALKFIQREQLNEFFEGDLRQVGIVLQGGLYNTTIRALQQLGLADATRLEVVGERGGVADIALGSDRARVALREALEQPAAERDQRADREDREQQPLDPRLGNHPRARERADDQGADSEEQHEEAAGQHHLDGEERRAEQHPGPPRHRRAPTPPAADASTQGPRRCWSRS